MHARASRQELSNIAAAFSINKTDTCMHGKYICFSLKGAPRLRYAFLCEE
jgi:hypothetical protein